MDLEMVPFFLLGGLIGTILGCAFWALVYQIKYQVFYEGSGVALVVGWVIEKVRRLRR